MWISDDERLRKQEEDDRLDLYDDPTEFNALNECGHRKPSDLLDNERVEDHFVWDVAGHDVKAYYWMRKNLDIMEITELFALRRVDQYLELEDEDAPPEARPPAAETE